MFLSLPPWLSLSLPLYFLALSLFLYPSLSLFFLSLFLSLFFSLPLSLFSLPLSLFSLFLSLFFSPSFSPVPPFYLPSSLLSSPLFSRSLSLSLRLSLSLSFSLSFSLSLMLYSSAVVLQSGSTCPSSPFPNLICLTLSISIVWCQSFSSYFRSSVTLHKSISASEAVVVTLIQHQFSTKVNTRISITSFYNQKKGKRIRTIFFKQSKDYDKYSQMPLSAGSLTYTARSQECTRFLCR